MRISVWAFVILTFQTQVFARSIPELEKLLHEKNYSQAFILAEELSVEHAGELEFDAFYGFAALEANEPAKAIFAYERVLAQKPQDYSARFNLMIALVKVGDYTNAKVHIQILQNQEAIPDALKRDIASFSERIKQLTKLKKATNVQALFRAAMGYNSNINTSPSAATLSILAQPELKLRYRRFGRPPPEQPDGFVNFNSSLASRQELSKNLNIYGSLFGGWRKNFQSWQYDYNELALTVGLSWRLGIINLRFPARAEQFIFAYKGKRIAGSFVPEATLDVVKGHSARLSSGYSVQVDTLDDRRNTSVLSLNGSWRARTPEGLFSTELTLFYNWSLPFQNKFAYLSRDYFGGKWDNWFRPSKEHMFDLGVRLQQSLYLDVDPRPIGATLTRSDFEISTKAAWRWTVTPNLSLEPCYNLTLNNSNIPFYEHRRHQIQLSIQYALDT